MAGFKFAFSGFGNHVRDDLNRVHLRGLFHKSVIVDLALMCH